MIAMLRETIKLDGGITRAAFKGLVPFFIARKILETTVSTINGIENTEDGGKA